MSASSVDYDAIDKRAEGLLLKRHGIVYADLSADDRVSIEGVLNAIWSESAQVVVLEWLEEPFPEEVVWTLSERLRTWTALPDAVVDASVGAEG